VETDVTWLSGVYVAEFEDNGSYLLEATGKEYTQIGDA
jgi:hypothetical protein